MTPDWQDIAALGLVALAMGYLARSAMRAASSRKAGAGCGSGCGGCPGGSGAVASDRGEPLVTIGPPRVPPRRGN